MELGVRSNGVVGDGLEEKMAIVKELGYDFLELALSDDEVENMTLKDHDKYRTAAERTGCPIRQTSIGHLVNLGERSESERQRLEQHLLRVIDLTHAVGGDVVLVAVAESSDDIAALLPSYQSILASPAEYAQEHGVVLALEAIRQWPPSVLDGLVRRLDHHAIAMYYDMGNCVSGGEDPVEEVKRSADITAAIHIKPAGGGVVDDMPLMEILEILEKSAFSGRGCLEISPKDESNQHLVDALQVLRSVGYQRD